MDNLAHTLAGLALSRAGLGRTSEGATLTLVLAANLPDADVVTRLMGTASYLEHHRGISHSLVGAPLLAVALAALVRLFAPRARFLPLLMCSLAGVASHVFMDLWTSYGTRVLSPFDATWYAWDVVFIVDPIVWALLLLSAAVFRGPDSGRRLATLGLGLVVTYVGVRAVFHAQALETAARVLPAGETRRLAALPSPLSPFRWKILADGPRTLYSGELDLLKPLPPLQRREKHPEDALIAQAREESSAAAVFLEFSRFPWLEVAETPEGRAVSWRDLRFEDVPGLVGSTDAERIRGRRGFVAQVIVGPDGRIRSESIRF
jgi:inner membrane protein